MADLETNYKDDIFSGDYRKYRQINNSDGTISLSDVTEYSQTGDKFGAADINATNAAVNQLNQNLTELGGIRYNEETHYIQVKVEDTWYNIRYVDPTKEVVPLVPAMTSDTTPSGQVIYSAQNTGDSRLAWKAFDGNNNTTWDCYTSGPLATNQYIGYKFDSPVIVKKVRFISEDGYRVKNYRIQASTDNSTWVDLYTGTCENTHPSTVWTEVEIDSISPYLYLRILVEDIYTGATMIGIQEIQFYGYEV